MNWEEAIAELIGLVKSAAPALWEVARRQAYANAAQKGIALLMMISAIGLLVRGARKAELAYTKAVKEHDGVPRWKWIRTEEDNGGYWFLMFCAVLTGVFATLLAGDLVAQLINPDYYAIKVIIDLVKLGR